MPELPEVETVRRSLFPYLKGVRIENVEILFAGIVKEPEPALFREKIKGRTVKEIKRRGKYLLFTLDEDLTLVIHLRMTGQLTICSKEFPLNKHTHLTFALSSGKELRFTDVRKFGLVYLVPTGKWEGIKGLFNLGFEPLAPDFTFDVFTEFITNKQGKLKPFLLDQSKIAGIGNIYADEILFEAGLHPQREIKTLTPREIKKLYFALRTILEESINCRGTTMHDFVDGHGKKGSFQERLQVYGRRGEACNRCGTRLQRIVVAGRGTVFCPHCQKKK
ncbi:MAG: bifunctional DNA-formamidopyrimidine glycosylase/DNA-(apurinic or apyrimidinic site) lyase [Clostridia bacterium]|nr:bifunctional DNA-formamidopyrimidine glycosylase/DNA-(apurinic or apyrimidinic site) lyase [Clostridia bacterium]